MTTWSFAKVLDIMYKALKLPSLFLPSRSVCYGISCKVIPVSTYPYWCTFCEGKQASWTMT